MAASSCRAVLCDIIVRLGSIAMQLQSTAPALCPIACHCVCWSHELADCYVILFGCYGTVTRCFTLPVMELCAVATHPRASACYWALLAASVFVWLLLWSFWALPRGLELELGAESLGPNRGRGGNNQHGKSVVTERQRRMMRWRTEAGVEGK